MPYDVWNPPEMPADFDWTQEDLDANSDSIIDDLENLDMENLICNHDFEPEDQIIVEQRANIEAEIMTNDNSRRDFADFLESEWNSMSEENKRIALLLLTESFQSGSGLSSLPIPMANPAEVVPPTSSIPIPMVNAAEVITPTSSKTGILFESLNEKENHQEEKGKTDFLAGLGLKRKRTAAAIESSQSNSGSSSLSIPMGKAPEGSITSKAGNQFESINKKKNHPEEKEKTNFLTGLFSLKRKLTAVTAVESSQSNSGSSSLSTPMVKAPEGSFTISKAENQLECDNEKENRPILQATYRMNNQQERKIRMRFNSKKKHNTNILQPKNIQRCSGFQTKQTTLESQDESFLQDLGKLWARNILEQESIQSTVEPIDTDTTQIKLSEPPSQNCQMKHDSVYAVKQNMSGTMNNGVIDTGTLDTGSMDTGTMDTGTMDTDTMDTGTMDTGTMDTGTMEIKLSEPSSQNCHMQYDEVDTAKQNMSGTMDTGMEIQLSVPPSQTELEGNNTGKIDAKEVCHRDVVSKYPITTTKGVCVLWSLKEIGKPNQVPDEVFWYPSEVKMPQ